MHRFLLALLALFTVGGACKSSSPTAVAPAAAAAPPAADKKPAADGKKPAGDDKRPADKSAEGDDDAPIADEDLGLLDPAKKPTHLKPFLGEKLSYVNFWATWCAPCREEMPRLTRLHEKYKAKGFRVVGVSLDGDPALVERFLKKSPVGYPILFGSKQTSDKLGDVTALPITLVVDPAGKIQRVYYGALDEGAEADVDRQFK